MSMAMVEEHTRQMPALQAREALLLSTIAAVGSGRMKPQGVRSILRGWRKDAQVDDVQRPPDKAAWRRQVAAFGITVTEAPWPGKKS